MNRDNSFFEFDAENSVSSTSKKPRWLVLSVEDNETFQQSLLNALSRMIVQGQTMEVLTASSAEEAQLVLDKRPDINLILLDVVMETDDAGLRLVDHIRSTLNNPIIRIILLTGQPGIAPNRHVMEQYDIDDYWSKTDLGEEHLFNVMNGNLKTWRRMNELKNARQGLERVVSASQAISRHNDLPHFSQTVLEEIDRIIGITDGGIMSLKMTEPLDLEKDSAVLAATGQYQPYIGQSINTLENEILLKRIKKTIQQKQHMFVGRYSLLYFSFKQPSPVYYLIVVKSATALTESDVHLLKVFGENIYNGFANIALTEYLNELAFKHWQTGIYNRNWFCQQLAMEEYWAKQAQIVLISIDRFSDITVTFGEKFAIQLLKTVYDELSLVEGIQAIAIISRDAFAILLDKSHVLSASRFDEILGKKKHIQHREHKIIAKAISAQLEPSLNRSPERLLGQLESHLYRLRATSSSHFHHVSLDNEAMFSKHLEMLNDFNIGLTKNEIQAYLQPKVDMVTGKLIGFEALARWFKSDGEMVPPDIFIPIAEASGLVEQLDKAILLQCCAAIKQLQAVGVSVPISFNVSCHELLLSDFSTTILSLLEAEAISPHQVDMEITETLAMIDYEQVSATLKKLIALGMDVSIDDFGTGFSSLSHVTELAATTLKIDKSFVQYLGERESSEHVVDMIIRVAKKFGLKVIAEGVETTLQRDKLIELGCTFGQGYFYARPMPIDEAVKWAIEQQ